VKRRVKRNALQPADRSPQRSLDDTDSRLPASATRRGPGSKTRGLAAGDPPGGNVTGRSQRYHCKRIRVAHVIRSLGSCGRCSACLFFPELAGMFSTLQALDLVLDCAASVNRPIGESAESAQPECRWLIVSRCDSVQSKATGTSVKRYASRSNSILNFSSLFFPCQHSAVGFAAISASRTLSRSSSLILGPRYAALIARGFL
jgi:hypothetical protein